MNHFYELMGQTIDCGHCSVIVEKKSLINLANG